MFLLFSYILSYRFFIESYCTDMTFDAHPHSGWFICLERFAFETGLISPTKLSPEADFSLRARLFCICFSCGYLV